MDEYERPGIVHRLDQDTTGVLIIARTAKALSKLSGFFAERQTEKKYLALCIGRLTESPCRLETLIGRHPVDRKRMAVVTKNGKTAISTFIERAAHDDVSLIEAEIESGRTHQIRVHLKHLQCPILGDTVYGSKKDDSGAERQMLHAWQLKIPHPETGDILHFTAPCPPDFSQTAAALKLTLP